MSNILNNQNEQNNQTNQSNDTNQTEQENKNPIKILIYGSNGWIGSQFIEILDKVNENKNENKNALIYKKGTARVDIIEDVEKEVTLFNPTHIVSFIGRTHGKIGETEYSTIDYLEQPGKLVENIRDNLFSPISLSLLCESRNIHLTYLGTGCIFSFDDEHPFGKEESGFTENSKPNFFGSSYSIVKGFTDRLMHQLNQRVLNLRIRMPITASENPRNFITKITNYEKICSIPNSMTVLPELLPVVLDLLKKKYNRYYKSYKSRFNKS